MLVLAISAVTAAPANASEPTVGAAKAQTCWLNTDTGVTKCFMTHADFVSAVTALTGGTLQSAGATAPASANPDEIQPLTTYILAIFYMDAGYSGTSLNITTSHSTLCTSYSYTANSMPSGWNDDVSSFHSYGTCKTRLSENINQGGSQYGPVANASALGVMNDAASSYWITG